MIVRKLRLKRGWSQDQLAQLSGLNIRTIQRIERGQNASLESMKSLAAVFEIDHSELIEQPAEPTMSEQKHLTAEEQQAIEYVRDIKGFYSHLIVYVCVISGLLMINLFTFPDYIWAKWAAFGWGIGIISHALSTFEVVKLFGPDWEKKQVEKKLGRKL